MKPRWRPAIFRAVVCLAPLLSVTGCPVEERTLEYGYAIGSAGHGDAATAGEGSLSGENGGGFGNSEAGGGAPAGGGGAEASGGAPPPGGEDGGPAGGATMGGKAGSAASGGSMSGSAGGMGMAGGGGTMAGGGGTMGGGGGTMGGGGGAVAGSAGNPDAGNCGDIDLNGVQDCEETRVTNAAFDQNVSPWTAEANVEQVWSASDARGKAASGSIVVTNKQTAGAEGWGLAGSAQCVAVAPGQVFEIGARARVAAGQEQGRAVVNIAVFGNDGCQGTFLGSATPALLAANGQWHVLRGTAKMPAAARSLYLRLGAEKPYSQPSLEVHFDDVLVHQK